ncbi:hypothetical protein DFJ74DRAFT_678582 [Hyaloraphidium curvatum]|nr:hypothetical protein DFJ74DRAFT_678582 [Hyaloraphidium curvatum]
MSVGGRAVTIKSLLSKLKVSQLLSDIPAIPVLSSGINGVLNTQIKDISLVFCKRGAAASGCATRFSLRAVLPPGMFRFDFLPISFGNPAVVFAVLDPFGAQRAVDVRIEGSWSVGGVPLAARIGRADGVDTSGDFPDGAAAVESEEEARRRLFARAERSRDRDPDAFFAETAPDDRLPAPEIDGIRPWAEVPPLSDAKELGFFEIPLAHVNHHLFRRHLAAVGANETAPDLQRRLWKRQKAASKGRSQASRPSGGSAAPAGVPANGGGQWVISVTAERLGFGDVIKQLGAAIFPSGPVEAIIDKLKLRAFELEQFRLAVILGSGDAVVRFSAGANVLPGAVVQVIAGKQAGGALGGTLALGIRGDMFTKLLAKMIPGFKVPGLDLVASGMTMGLIISSSSRYVEGTPMAFDPPLQYIPEIKRGLSLNLRMGLPPDCGGQQFCEVMVMLLGQDAALQISAVVNPPDVTVSAGVSDLRITDGLVLQQVGFEASFPALRLMLVGALQLHVDKSQPPITLSAFIGVKSASVILGGSMKGIWRRAFGWERLNVGNLILEVGITATLGAPSVLLGGEVAIGKNCYTPDNQFDVKSQCIGGSVYLSIDPANPQNNWFGGEISNIDFKTIIAAFTGIRISPDIIPAPILNSGFPGKNTLSLCPMGGCVVPGREFPMGFFFKGTLNILDVTADAEISINPAAGIRVKASLTPLKLGDGLIMAYFSRTDRKRGPMLDLNLQMAQPTAISLQLNAFVRVLMFEVDAQVSISPTRYSVGFAATYYEFRADFKFEASIGARLDFAVAANLQNMDRFIDRVVDAVTKWAQAGAKALKSASDDVANKRAAVEKAKKAACDWKKKCKQAADKVKCGRRRLLVRRGALLSPGAPVNGGHRIALEKRLGKIKSWGESVGRKIKDTAEDTFNKVKKGVCKGWTAVSGFAINTACQSACTAAQGALDIATGSLKAAEGTLNGLSSAVKAAAKIATWIQPKIKQMIGIQTAAISAKLDAGFKAGFMSGAVTVRIMGVIMGQRVDVQFAFNFKNIGATAERFFEQHLKGIAEKVANLFRLAERDVEDVEFLPHGHFRFRKRDLLDTPETILFDSRVMTLDEAIDLHLQRRLRLEKRGGTAQNQDGSDPGQHVSASELPVIPALAPGYYAGPPPGMPGGEDNDFRLKFGDDLYVSCGTMVGAFSREGPPCALRKKMHSTVFLSTKEPHGQSFRVSGGFCLGVNARSSLVLTPCLEGRPNGVWAYNNRTGQLTPTGAGVAIARDFGSPVMLEDVVLASTASDGRCLAVTRKKKLRLTRCADPSVDQAGARVQRFEPRINAESINLGDLISFHSVGSVGEEYIATEPLDGDVVLRRGKLDVQQADRSAAFRVVEPICGASYHFTLESVLRPGQYLALAASNSTEIVLTDRPRRKEDACWLPTPGPARPGFGSGCPGITFALRARNARELFMRASDDGKDVYAAGGQDPALLTCWRPVPPEGAPSAATTAEEQEEEGPQEGREVEGSAEDVEEDGGLFGED